MRKNINIISTPAPKAAGNPQSDLFDNFCELLTRMFFALEEECWAEETGWDIAFGQSMSEAEAAWKLVALQADDVTAVQPLSASDLILHRMAGLVKRAVSASNVATLCDIHAKAMQCVAEASPRLAAPVRDLVQEAETCIEQMFEHAHACEGDDMQDSILPLAA
ncbi:hypothetical protein [uncultured Roseovarius sp.]|uniref:hypothetical protein n=1 Tax=uncultured Roseovarius sp. TaxID=293344 RepID=UPI0025F321BA|nr:hypothetical protein [uncultured Roseovarius sp.]